jgi:inner membrane transporter RhtA
MTAPGLVLTTSPEVPDPRRSHGAFTRAAAAVPPPGLMLISVVSVQVGAAVAIRLFPVIGPITTTFLRIAFSALLLLVASRRTIDRGAWRHAGSLLAFGFVMAAMNLCFYGAIARIPLGIAVAIEFIGPLGLAALTSRRMRDFAWIALAVAGIALLTPDIGVALDPLGVGFALLAAVGWAAYVILSRRVGRALPGGSGLALTMLVATVVTLPAELATGGLGELDTGLLAGAFAVAILSTALPLSLEFEALKRMTARTYGILVTLEPAVAALVGAVALGQAMGPKAILAVACVTAAALGVTISDRRGST